MVRQTYLLSERHYADHAALLVAFARDLGCVATYNYVFYAVVIECDREALLYLIDDFRLTLAN